MRVDRKCFVASLLILFAYLFPVLTSNVYYFDDLSRVLLGYGGWSGDGRPVAQRFYKVLSFGSRLPDLFPFPLMISMVFTSLVFSGLSNTLGNGRSILFAFCISPLILSPLFVSNLHFRYDAPFMMLAIAFSLVPFCEVFKNTYASFALACASIVLSFSSYQTAVNVFIIFSALEMLINTPRSGLLISFKKASVRFFSLVVGFVIYSMVIIPRVHTYPYFDSYNKTVAMDASLFSTLSDNFMYSLDIFRDTINHGFYVFTVSAFLIFVTSVYFMVARGKRLVGNKRACAIIFAALMAGVVMIFGICGIVLLGEHPLFFSRVYIGFGAFIAALLLPLCWLPEKKIMTPLMYTLLGCVCLYMFSFGFAATNAIRLQNQHAEYIATMIINDLNESDMAAVRTITIRGVLKVSPAADVAVRAFPLVRRVLPQTFDGGYDGGRFIINRLGRPDITYRENDSVDVECRYQRSRFYYDICMGEASAQINFK